MHKGMIQFLKTFHMYEIFLFMWKEYLDYVASIF
jgi:hypothetical protein